MLYGSRLSLVLEIGARAGWAEDLRRQRVPCLGSGVEQVAVVLVGPIAQVVTPQVGLRQLAFSPASGFLTGGSPILVLTGDLGNDQQDDLVAVTEEPSGGLGPDPIVFGSVNNACPVELDNNGSVNTLDSLVLLNVWSAAAEVADWNGDGRIDILDSLAFLNEWVAGC